MKMRFDQDLHIHTQLSSCSQDPEQTKERILRYAQENDLHTVCVTDHFWDTDVPGMLPFYEGQDLAHIHQVKPLPQAEGTRFLFGGEADLNWDLTLGLSQEHFDAFDFVVISTTHLHMQAEQLKANGLSDAQGRAKVWKKRLEAVLNMPLPFHKIGIAHLTCPLIAPTREMYLQTLDLLEETDLFRLFGKAAALGVGVELNSRDMQFADEETETVLRPYHIAKACGCKFYFGSDAHHPAVFESVRPYFERAIDLLDLRLEDRFFLLE